LFTGDAEIDEELSVVESQQVLQSTLLKVGHHGSYTSTSEDFLKAVNPEYAIISVGSNNEYGHPHDIVLNRLSKYCQEIYRTDIVGEIICSSDGEKLTFSFKP
jgi:competence protein ComEC